MNNFLFTALFALSLYSGALIGQDKPSKGAIVLTTANHIAIVGEVTDASMSTAKQQLADLLIMRGNSKYPIYVVLDTPGGSVLAGYSFYEFVKTYENVHTITINSFSMGAVLVQLIAGERLMLETGVLMYHRMKAGVMPTTTDHIDAQLEWVKSMEEFAERKISDRSGIHRDELRKKIDREWFLNPHTAINNGLMDRTVSVKCSTELLKRKINVRIEIFPGVSLEKQRSACPLL